MDCKTRKALLSRITNYLIINSSFLENLGLFHGKMGIVIFFFHYARFTNNPIYDEFAGELLDEIFEEIHDRLPIDFENGYLGIGWGIEYLASQKFIIGDTNDILEDVDKKIMERDIRRISDMSFLKEVACTLQSITTSELLKELCDDYKHWFNNTQLEYTPLNFLKQFYSNEIPTDDKIYEWNIGLKEGSAGIGLALINLKKEGKNENN